MKPCSYCSQHQKSCKVDVRSGRCAECVRRGRACNVRTTKAESDKPVAARSTLKNQGVDAAKARAEARQAELLAHEAAQAAQAKEDRLRKQLELIEKRDHIAFDEELAEVDELDPPIPHDLTNDLLAWDDQSVMSPSRWASFVSDDLDFVSESPGATASNA